MASKKTEKTTSLPPFEPGPVLRSLARRFREIGNPERADREKAYMKSELRFHGITSPQMAVIVRELLASRERPNHPSLRTLVDEAYASGWFDLRSAALSILSRNAEQLGPEDLPWLVVLVRRSACWAHVDFIAPKMIGDILASNPAYLPNAMRQKLGLPTPS